MEHVLSILYGASGIAATALYLPQIIKYHRDRDACQSISLLTWSGWVLITAITILYALYVLNSRLFATVAAMNVMAQLTVLGYGINARAARRCAMSRNPAAGAADAGPRPSAIASGDANT
ncbi:hypothetical protein [Noviherbaspirillum cavernae]|nr:hypothetical protein [Noviherbaspirillum cavernae]